MNLIQVQEQLKGLPTQAIMAYANGHNPEVPPYVALAELNRRKQMEQGGAAMQGGKKPTIKDQVEQSVGLMGLQQAKQQQAMQQVAQAAPQTPIPEQAPQGPVQGEPQGFAEGGSIDENPDDMYFMSKDEGGSAPGVVRGTSWEDFKRMLRGKEEPSTNNLTEEQKAALTAIGNSIATGNPVEPVQPAGADKAKTTLTPEESGGLRDLANAIVQGKGPSVPQVKAPATGNPFAAKEQAAPLPAPAVVAKNIAQDAPAAAKPEPQGLEAVFTKQAMEAMQAKPDLEAGMKTAEKVITRPKTEIEYEQSLRDQRAADLARRQAPKNWYENEGLMAQLRSFAQADPRRALGAGAAASAEFYQQQQKQRAAEDALFREGLGELSKAEQARVKSRFDYAVEEGKSIREAKKAAMNDTAQLLVAKGNNAANILGHQISAAATRYVADKSAETREGIAGLKAEGQEGKAALAAQQAAARDPEYKRLSEIVSILPASSPKRKEMEAKMQSILQRYMGGATIAPQTPTGSGSGQFKVLGSRPQ